MPSLSLLTMRQASLKLGVSGGFTGVGFSVSGFWASERVHGVKGERFQDLLLLRLGLSWTQHVNAHYQIQRQSKHPCKNCRKSF